MADEKTEDPRERMEDIYQSFRNGFDDESWQQRSVDFRKGCYEEIAKDGKVVFFFRVNVDDFLADAEAASSVVVPDELKSSLDTLALMTDIMPMGANDPLSTKLLSYPGVKSAAMGIGLDPPRAATLDLYGTFWLDPETLSLLFMVGDPFSTSPRPVLGFNVESMNEFSTPVLYPFNYELHEILQARNKSKGYPPPDLEDESSNPPDSNESITDGILTPVTKKQPRTAKDGAMLYAANSVTQQAVFAFTQTEKWQVDPKPGFARGISQETASISVFFGVRTCRYTEPLGAFLAKGGVAFIKGYYAMWGLWYKYKDAPGGFIRVDVGELCDWLGYKKHQKGGHRKENKQRAVDVINLLTEIELQAEYRRPAKGKNPPTKERLRGLLWNRGIEHDMVTGQFDEFSDLFGAARVGDESLWEPKSCSFRPGEWFSNPIFSEYATAVGEVSKGLLSLENKEEWAIKVGGYLCTIIRANGYKPKVLQVETILQRSNVGLEKWDYEHPSVCEEKLYRALERLKEVNVIGEWAPTDVDITEPDMDDPDAVAAHGADISSLAPGNAWRARKLIIHWASSAIPAAKRIADSKAKHIATAQKRSANLRRGGVKVIEVGA